MKQAKKSGRTYVEKKLEWGVEPEEKEEPKPVTCLGITFESDDERRKYFTKLLREKLKDPEFRKIEGFPIGEDEDILALSDPPYYTACPNPWIADFIAEWEEEKKRLKSKVQGPKSKVQSQESEVQGSGGGGDSTLDPGPETLDPPYHREPFAADVSEGKNDPIYNAHSYHTKVPHKAIMRYILHYTEPGDIVFDGFCGTGMTGVAAQMCGDRDTVMSLGYRVEKDGTILQEETDETGKKVLNPFSKLGARKAVLNDLSPAATFIAYNYNTPVDVKAFEKEAKRILKEVEEECGWMYETLHVEPASSRLLQALEFQGCNPFEVTDASYRKDNLPHIEVKQATYFITFRTHNNRKLSKAARQKLLDSLLYWDKQRWRIFSAVVMPDHVHLLAKPLPKNDEGECWKLEEIIHSIKSYSANEINKLDESPGSKVWQTEYYDRIVRDADELSAILTYIYLNPYRAGIVSGDGYPYSYVAGSLNKAGWKPAPLGKINYTVWSDVFICPECSQEVIFWEAAVDKKAGKVRDSFPCSKCQATLTKRTMERAWVSKYDQAIKQTIRHAKQVPVLINYSLIPASIVEPASSRLSDKSSNISAASSIQSGKSLLEAGSTYQARGKRYEKKPDIFDLGLIEKIENSEIPYWYPTDPISEGDKTGEPLRIGITHAHHFYSASGLGWLSAFREKCKRLDYRYLVPFSMINTISKLYRYNVKKPNYKGQGGGILTGTLYVPSLIRGLSASSSYKRGQSRLGRIFEANCHFTKDFILSISSSSNFHADDECLDYIFIDPPFGSNLNYSELSFLWESWLGVKTNIEPEAIENKSQGKGGAEYRDIMTKCFSEAYRLLKPGRWMTVEFSNTKASVWNSIQTALTEAGFIVANVSALNKKQGSFNAVTNTTSVKQDLVISAYKPNGGFEKRFLQSVQSEEGVWEFVRTHLKYLPVTKNQAGVPQVIPERDPRILFDQMVAYYVRKGYPVPISSQEFQEGLAQRFSERDGMYFLPEQTNEYDRKKMMSGKEVQLYMAVFDENSAIQWLRYLLRKKPQTFSDINPQFMKQLGGWKKNEAPLDLRELLNQNFLCYDGKEAVPSQIHSYLSTNWPELRNMDKDDPVLKSKAKDRWYVPDPRKAGDLEKMRDKVLLKEFEQYKQAKKKLKVFRLEAVRAGFKKAWQQRDYSTIITIAEKIPNKILEEDPKLLMWYDQAVTRDGGGE
ncbi:REP-associated tyrosine transposase [Desulfonatronovibrio magnus]|uniref:REP-associated tyrosine transposase n=1 Tax=Desulfonatronovibrio magnus TaxID=698827 RepID=UPI00069740CB|nr:DNA methyltransferase [Desulfonatronovibrio magnus]